VTADLPRLGPRDNARSPFHKKVWGFELWIVNNDVYCGKKLVLYEGAQSSLHYHEIKDETFFVQSGLVRFEKDDEVLTLGPGDSVHVPPGCIHRFAGMQFSEIFEFSTHHEESDSYRLKPSMVRI
jgi:mannose-6-phosphate isomerase-like protein (cupin superfamily)